MPEKEDFTCEGSLCVAFSNGDKQTIPLVASVVHPQLTLSSSVMEYGKIHTSAPKPMQLMLTNESLAGASWAVVEAGVEESSPPYQRKADAMAGVEEEAVFGAVSVRPAAGFIPGRGLKMPF